MLPWGTFDLSLMEEVQQTKLAEAQQRGWRRFGLPRPDSRR